MKLVKIIVVLLPVLFINNCKNHSDKSNVTTTNIVFLETENTCTNLQKQQIREIIINSEKEVRQLLLQLPDSIKVTIEIVDWNINAVGGVTGRTETNSPPHVAIQISNKFPGGITNAVATALSHVIFHEFHHLYRGWAIKDNVFEPGISIAAVNEGLAVVFSEEYTDLALDADRPPAEDIADQWVKEILELPKDADYQKWMFEHPDGRLAVGYRAGHFLVRQAMANSRENILELSKRTPDDILRLAGY